MLECSSDIGGRVASIFNGTGANVRLTAMNDQQVDLVATDPSYI